jgi:hypothetical protein
VSLNTRPIFKRAPFGRCGLSGAFAEYAGGDPRPRGGRSGDVRRAYCGSRRRSRRSSGACFVRSGWPSVAGGRSARIWTDWAIGNSVLPVTASAGEQVSVYEAAGGAPAMLALAHAWHQRCLADPEARHPFSHPGLHPQHTERLAAYWGEMLGGPDAYSRELGQQVHRTPAPIGEAGAATPAIEMTARDDSEEHPRRPRTPACLSGCRSGV